MLEKAPLERRRIRERCASARFDATVIAGAPPALNDAAIVPVQPSSARPSSRPARQIEFERFADAAPEGRPCTDTADWFAGPRQLTRGGAQEPGRADYRAIGP